MKVFIVGLSQQTISRVFYAVYGAVLLLALFPPLYLTVSGLRSPLILGVPFAIAYWIFDAVLLGVSLWVLYTIEGIRGELADNEAKGSDVL
jgi:hypothetical protein